MTLQQIYYAITISEQGSFNKASEVLYISQPSLTESVRELEKELGIIIFHRSGKGVTLTSDGAGCQSKPPARCSGVSFIFCLRT